MINLQSIDKNIINNHQYTERNPNHKSKRKGSPMSIGTKRSRSKSKHLNNGYIEKNIVTKYGFSTKAGIKPHQRFLEN